MFDFIHAVFMLRIRKVESLIKAFNKALKKNNGVFNDAICDIAFAAGDHETHIWWIVKAFPNIANAKTIAKATDLAFKAWDIWYDGHIWWLDNHEINLEDEPGIEDYES